jgi:hypothetical protein
MSLPKNLEGSSGQHICRRANSKILGRRCTSQSIPSSSASQEICVVRLLPAANFGDDICCELSIAALQADSVYKALSYTWGNMNDTVPIILNGRTFLVTRNLEKAPRRLRSLKQDSVFWIDAICINQTDIAERTQQVRLMRTIYEKAEEVFVWLGSATEFAWDDLWLGCRSEWAGDETDIDNINNLLNHAENLAETPAKLRPSLANRLLLAFCLLRLLSGDIRPTPYSKSCTS